MTITVWDKGENFCPECFAVKKAFDLQGVVYETKDLTAPENHEMLEWFKSQGYAKAPIVETPTHRFAGNRPDEVTKVVDEAHSYQQAQVQQAATVLGPGVG